MTLNHFFFCIIFFLLSLTSCSQIGMKSSGVPSITPTTHLSTNTPSPLPTQTYTPTSKPTNTATKTPTSSPTPIPTLIGGYPGNYIKAFRIDNEWQINLYKSNGSLEKTIFKYIFNPDDRSVDYLLVQVSPAGDRILLNFQKDSISQIMVIDPDGIELFTFATNLGFYGGHWGQANWSPDGQWIVFTSRGDNTYTDIYLVDKNGENLEQLTNNYEENSAPVFLPQGKKIQYFEGTYAIIMNLEDKIVASLGGNYPYAWSKAEKSFISIPINWLSLKLTNTETNETKTIFNVQTTGKFIHIHDVRFSPDDQWVLVSERNADMSKPDLIPFGYAWYKVNLNNVEKPELIAYADYVNFSPDESMMIIHGILPDEKSTFGGPKYYALKLPEMDVIPLEEVANGFTTGHWITGTELGSDVDPISFIGPTLVPTWPAMAEPAIYDSFDKNVLDERLWTLSDSSLDESFTWQINQESFNIQTPQKVNSKGIAFYNKESFSSKTFEVVESKIKLWSGTYGRSSIAYLKLHADTWFIQCNLTHQNLSSYFGCDVANDLNGKRSTEYSTQTVPIELNKWYTIRVEFSHSSGALQFYLNEELVNTYRPNNANRLLAGISLLPGIGVYAADGGVNASFDDFRLGVR